MATIQPLAAILSELTRGRATVHTLVPPGASPHTYDLRASDMRAAENTLAVFYVHGTLDGWAAKIPAREKIAAFDLLPGRNLQQPVDHRPEHFADSNNPHFWVDPLFVKAIIPPLVDVLSYLDPDGTEPYRTNADRFIQELNGLHDEIAAMLRPVQGASAIAMHPSWAYFFDRYAIETAATIEPSPGKEPTPKDVKRLIDAASAHHAKAVFTEPQLPRRPAEVVAEAAGIPIYELDPIGGIQGRTAYREWILYNARIVRDALQ